jgi:hypothetical protein
MGFKSVLLYQPIDDRSGELNSLYPPTFEMPTQDEAAPMRSTLTLLVDQTDFEVGPDGSVSCRICPPPGRKTRR